jgi:hypothetical protein
MGEELRRSKTSLNTYKFYSNLSTNDRGCHQNPLVEKILQSKSPLLKHLSKPINNLVVGKPNRLAIQNNSNNLASISAGDKRSLEGENK